MHPLETINQNRKKIYNQRVEEYQAYKFHVFRITNTLRLIWVPILILSIGGIIYYLFPPTVLTLSFVFSTALTIAFWALNKHLLIKRLGKSLEEPLAPFLFTGWHLSVYDHLETGNYLVLQGTWTPSPDTLHEKVLQSSISWIESLTPGTTNFSIKVTPMQVSINNSRPLTQDEYWTMESQRSRTQEPQTEVTETEIRDLFYFEMEKQEDPLR